jgi:DNA-binding NtrC family response regulator
MSRRYAPLPPALDKRSTPAILRIQACDDSNTQGARGGSKQRLVEDFARLNLVGESPAFLRCLALVRKGAACHATVLVQGETGTGKELAARAIPKALVENELFGPCGASLHGRARCRCGVIADFEGGTLFLDEVAALSFRGQVSLLRFLQDRQYRSWAPGAL